MKGLRWALFAGLGGLSLPVLAQSHDFAYQVMGDARVAPLQVFDDGERTFLQFRPDQPLPAVFIKAQGQTRLADHRVQGHYLVLPHAVDWMEVRIGNALAQIQYQGQRAAVSARVGEGVAAAVQMPVSLAPLPSALPVPDTARTSGSFSTHPEDLHLRGVLRRWAQQVGWTFQAEHWAVDIDVPLAGQAVLGAEFKEAVRALLRSTEMTRRPLQPCFYSNQVLRVIAYTQSCQPGAVKDLS